MTTTEYQADPAATAATELRSLPIDRITPAKDNPRKKLTDLDGLAASIREHGVLQPVLVTRTGDDTYSLVSGSRRLAAARRAGLHDIPALVRAFDPLARKASQIVENDERVGFTPLERAEAYQDLLTLGADEDAVAHLVGRPRADVDSYLAVRALPRSVHKLLADDEITFSEALLITELAEHPEDIESVVASIQHSGWGVAAAVRTVTAERTRATTAAASRERLAKMGVPIVDAPSLYSSREKVRRLGRGWNCVQITVARHRKQPCHAAYIAHDGTAEYVCTDPQRHADDASAGVEKAPDMKAQRAATRAANKAAREAGAARTAVTTTMLTTISAAGSTSALDFALHAMIATAPWEATISAAALLGLTEPDAQRYASATTRAFTEYAHIDRDHLVRAAVAVQCAIAERDAMAKHERVGSGRTILGYLDLLAHSGHEEFPGDAAVRARYGRAPIDFDNDDPGNGDDQEDDIE
jgi:ParB family chromosome partitioning protein